MLGGDVRNREERVERPTPVPGLSGVVGIAACAQAAAALTEDGTVWMWGTDEGGVMGTGRVNDRYESAREYHRPVRVQGVSDGRVPVVIGKVSRKYALIARRVDLVTPVG